MTDGEDKEAEGTDGGTHGMTKGVDESVLEWIGDEELPPPEENPQTAGTFMPSMYSNPYWEKLEKARATGEPDPSPEPSAAAAKEEAEKYLTPKDVTTCVSNNVRSIDSWCRDMCGAGVCTAEMCVCDGEAGADADADAGADAGADADADADADATEAAPAAGHERLATPSATATAPTAAPTIASTA